MRAKALPLAALCFLSGLVFLPPSLDIIREMRRAIAAGSPFYNAAAAAFLLLDLLSFAMALLLARKVRQIAAAVRTNDTGLVQ
jgi:hypothetical protein